MPTMLMVFNAGEQVPYGFYQILNQILGERKGRVVFAVDPTSDQIEIQFTGKPTYTITPRFDRESFESFADAAYDQGFALAFAYEDDADGIHIERNEDSGITMDYIRVAPDQFDVDDVG